MGFRLGSTFGFEIRIDTSWFILAALILWTFAMDVFPSVLPGVAPAGYLLMAAMGAVLFFASLLIHELSHALVARTRGIPVDGITLFMFGGVAHTRTDAEKPGDEFMIAGAGPLTSVALAGLFTAIYHYGGALGLDLAVRVVARYLGYLNWILAIFNLLPGFPLDGGRLLRAILWKTTGNVTTATRWASRAGQLLGWGLVGWGAWIAIAYGYLGNGLWLMLIGWFLRGAAQRSYTAHVLQKHVERAQRTLGRLDEVQTLLVDDDGNPVRPAPPAAQDATRVRRGDPFVIPSDRLPPGFARSLDEPPAEPAEPAPAATAVLMRDGADGPEILLLRRHRSSGFVPGAWVFPGGRVDPADADRGLLSRVEGLPHPVEPPTPYWIAAAREVFEETGVLLGRCQASPEDREAARERLMSDEATMEQTLEALDARLELRDVAHVAHWVTPVVEPRRYDTHFFLAGLPAGTEARVDEREMTDARWLTADEALARFERGELPMVFPTVRTLQELRGYESAAAAIRGERDRDVPTILPRLVRRDGGVTIEIPEEIQEPND